MNKPSNFPSHVTLVDVGPRDGLQNEGRPVDAADKISLVHQLQAAGLRQIEVTSFVSPKWVPQMAVNAEVMAGIQRQDTVRYSVLTPNMKGFEGALAAGADEVVIFAAASEAFSQRNINCSIAESIERFRPVVDAAKATGKRVRAAVSCALGCPYQGEVTVDAVEDVVKRLLDIGSDHIGIADTIGVGTAGRVKAVMERLASGFTRLALDAGVPEAEAAHRAESALVAIQGSLVLARGLGDTGPFLRQMQALREHFLSA